MSSPELRALEASLYDTCHMTDRYFVTGGNFMREVKHFKINVLKLEFTNICEVKFGTST
jgi:hypothetical protein